MKLYTLIATAIFSVFLLLGIGWVWGAATIRFHVFPYDLAAQVYGTSGISEGDNFRIGRNLQPKYTSHQYAGYVRQILNRVQENPSDVRRSLKRKMLVPEDLVTITEMNNDDETLFRLQHSVPVDNSILVAKYYGVKTYGALRKSLSSDCLLVYIQGHRGNPFEKGYYKTIYNDRLFSSCDILSLSMTGLGLNEGPVEFPSIYGGSLLAVDAEEARTHDIYRWFWDESNPNIDGLALMLSGNYYLIEDLIGDYQDSTIIGISGGAWYATILAALLPNLSDAYAFSGSFPKAFRTRTADDRGDWEQIEAQIWREYDYWHFYLLALFDSEGSKTRVHHLIYNSDDQCCFADPSATAFASVLKELSVQGLEVTVLDKQVHDIDPQYFFDIFSSRRSKWGEFKEPQAR